MLRLAHKPILGRALPCQAPTWRFYLHQTQLLLAVVGCHSIFALGRHNCRQNALTLANLLLNHQPLQLILPVEGCRIIVASDGLWDVLTLSKAVKLVRSKPTSLAASTLVDAVKRDQRFMDDATVIVVDVLPPEVSG